MLSTLTLLPLAFTLLFAASAPALPRTGPDGKIHLQNPSFEDAPQQSAAPHGWQYFSPGSTPDIQPGIWGVQMAAQEGSTYVGLVAREDGTTEDVGQTLREDLLGGVCYEFSIYLAHSPKYAGYNHPLRLQVWGAASKGAKEQLLASSPLINHAEWKAYKLQFVPSRTLRYITLQAWYGPGVLFKYKGNILLDNCSPIERCDRA